MGAPVAERMVVGSHFVGHPGFFHPCCCFLLRGEEAAGTDIRAIQQELRLRKLDRHFKDIGKSAAEKMEVGCSTVEQLDLS